MKNDSGIQPLEFKVVIFPKPAAEKTAGGIIIPDDKQSRDQMAQIEGTLVEASPMAFTEPEWPVKPQPGDVVLFAKYAGYVKKGIDGKEYRVCSDKDIVAIMRN